MNELPQKYNPSEVEDKWYGYWTEHRLFHSEPDARPAYTIVIPPPNVTVFFTWGICSTIPYRIFLCGVRA